MIHKNVDKISYIHFWCILIDRSQQLKRDSDDYSDDPYEFADRDMENDVDDIGDEIFEDDEW